MSGSREARKSDRAWVNDVSKVVPGAQLPPLGAYWRPPSGDDVDPSYAPVDERAVESVRARVLNDIRLIVDDFHVSTRGRRLCLEGTVAADADRQQIVKFARELVGPHAVEDHLEIAA